MRSYCKQCNSESAGEWQRANQDKRCISSKKYYLNNRTKHLELTAQWKKDNPEKVRAYSYANATKRYKTVKGNLSARIAVGIRTSLKKSKNGRHWESLVGYTCLDLKKHIETHFVNGMNWDKFMAGEIHIDHIIPINSFDYTDTEQGSFKECWSLHNLQPLWAKDNIRKHAKLSGTAMIG